MKTAIIGIGSPFGEDRAGWEAVDKLLQDDAIQTQQRAEPPDILKLDRPGVNLLDTMQPYDRVILIDAIVSEEHAPGTLLKLQPEELETTQSLQSSHGFGVAEALALGESLGNLPKELEIRGIVVEQS